LARRSDLAAHRKSAREAAANLLTHLGKLPELPGDVADEIEDAALVTAWGRGAVPRNGYGRREIEGVPIVEEPMRLVQQLGGIARGVLALGLPATAASVIASRIALDSMPDARRAVLQVLAAGEVLSTSACARQAKLHRHVARMALEDLAAIRVVANNRQDEETDDHEGAVDWALTGDDAVFEAFHQSGGGWHETWVYTSTSPPWRSGESTSTGGIPTLRATLQPPTKRKDHISMTTYDEARNAWLAAHPEPTNLDFACPRCKARRGDPCRKPDGAILAQSHVGLLDRYCRTLMRWRREASDAADVAINAERIDR
jgi:hypothetical protein